jgi:hypothetical protein
MKMLNQNTVGLNVADACRPDPEHCLQQARQSKEKAMDDIAKFKAFMVTAPYFEHESQKGLKQVAGELLFNLWEAEESEEYWLKEIDKE